MSFFDYSSFTFFSFSTLPLWKVLIDSVFAVLMWGVLVRFVVIVLFNESPTVLALRTCVQLTNIVIRLLKPVMPAVMTPAARCLYAAFLLFLLRYYGLPALNNYRLNSLANLPFENSLATSLSSISRLISGIES